MALIWAWLRARRPFWRPLASPRGWRTYRLNRKMIGIALATSFGVCLVASLSQGKIPDDSPQELAAFGRFLFSAKALSSDRGIACASCHIERLGFSGDTPLARGVQGYETRRRAPGLYGLRNSTSFMWDGRALSLEQQAAMPLGGPEMNVDWSRSLPELQSDPSVRALMTEANIATLTPDIAVAAIAAYVRSLEFPRTRFDRFYFDHDETALSEKEQFGFRLFVRKAGCSSCHLVTGAAPFSDYAFHVTGAGIDDRTHDDRGREEVTGLAGDAYAFKTPSLRGVALRPFLMHNGRLRTLEQVVEYYNHIGGRDEIAPDPRLRPLSLNSDEVEAIVAFLKSLNPAPR